MFHLLSDVVDSTFSTLSVYEVVLGYSMELSGSIWIYLYTTKEKCKKKRKGKKKTAGIG